MAASSAQTGSAPAFMTAVGATAYGGPENLRLERVPVPQPGEGEALVRVRAAGINPLAWKVLRGDIRLVIGLRKPPRILGADLAGDVVALGPGAEGVQVGDAVAGMISGISGGAYAEYAAVPAGRLAKKPEAVPYEAAGALGVVGLTALQGLRGRAAVRSGERVLVNGASGGVGHVALQLAKRFGAEVTAVASGGAEAFVRELGADRFIDYRRTDFAQECAAYDVAFDAVGNRSFPAVRQALRSGGRYVTTTPFPPQFAWQVLTAAAPRALTSKRAFVLSARRGEGRLAELLAWMAAGDLRIAVDEVFPLAEAAAALRRGQGGGVQGKIVLEP